MIRRLTLSSLIFAALLALLIVGLRAAPRAAGGAWQPTASPAASSTPFAEPEGCREPPNDYTRLWVNGGLFNARTIAMLDHAQALYSAQGGVLDLRLAISQGSYTGGALAASFGTHDGGGAVDLSVRSPVDWSVQTEEIEPMLRALRIAGFAAWLREEDELYPGSVIHIHAIAIGDAELSEAARAQIDGTFGYLRGYNGLPQINGVPIPDRHGGPVICRWMIARGFRDMRGWPNPLPTPGGTAQAVTDLP